MLSKLTMRLPESATAQLVELPLLLLLLLLQLLCQPLCYRSAHTQTHTRRRITTTAAVVRFWLWLSARLIKNAEKRLKANSAMPTKLTWCMANSRRSLFQSLALSLSLPPFQMLFMRAAAFHQISKCGGKFVPRLHKARNLWTSSAACTYYNRSLAKTRFNLTTYGGCLWPPPPLFLSLPLLAALIER